MDERIEKIDPGWIEGRIAKKNQKKLGGNTDHTNVDRVYKPIKSKKRDGSQK